MQVKRSRILDEDKEEVVRLVGDPESPTSHGIASTVNLGHGAKHPRVRYKDFLLDCDLYQYPGEPPKLVLICPKCRNALSITGDKKKMEYEPNVFVEHGGRLSVEAFTCTWELDPEGRRMEFGLGLCNLSLVIDNNVARDA